MHRLVYFLFRVIVVSLFLVYAKSLCEGVRLPAAYCYNEGCSLMDWHAIASQSARLVEVLKQLLGVAWALLTGRVMYRIGMLAEHPAFWDRALAILRGGEDVARDETAPLQPGGQPVPQPAPRSAERSVIRLPPRPASKYQTKAHTRIPQPSPPVRQSTRVVREQVTGQREASCRLARSKASGRVLRSVNDGETEHVEVAGRYEIMSRGKQCRLTDPPVQRRSTVA